MLWRKLRICYGNIFSHNFCVTHESDYEIDWSGKDRI